MAFLVAVFSYLMDKKNDLQKIKKMYENLNFFDQYSGSLIIVIIVTYVINKLTLQGSNCNKIAEYTEQLPILLKDQSDTTKFNVPLNKVFVKTAYNCCCTGNFKNDYVGLCALENCYKQGVRALHFEVYSLNNKPIISSLCGDDEFK
jgi:hypothetical protein